MCLVVLLPLPTYSSVPSSLAPSSQRLPCEVGGLGVRGVEICPSEAFSSAFAFICCCASFIHSSVARGFSSSSSSFFLSLQVRQECSKFGEISRVEVHPLSDDVRIFVEFSSLTGAQEAIPSLHGRWFGGRQIIANTYSESSFAQGDFTQ